MLTPRRYAYVGPHAIKTLLEQPAQRVCVRHVDDVIRWFHDTQPLSQKQEQAAVATFIIDTNGWLWIADQRSEHVVCAGGSEVFSAGEITFYAEKNRVEVVEVTNQSTGYCPEPESWWAVAAALEQLGIAHPPDFTTAYLFRRCDGCGTTNIVKDGWFECAACQSLLSQHWNYSK